MLYIYRYYGYIYIYIYYHYMALLKASLNQRQAASAACRFEICSFDIHVWNHSHPDSKRTKGIIYGEILVRPKPFMARNQAFTLQFPCHPKINMDIWKVHNQMIFHGSPPKMILKYIKMLDCPWIFHGFSMIFHVSWVFHLFVCQFPAKRRHLRGRTLPSALRTFHLGAPSRRQQRDLYPLV